MTVPTGSSPRSARVAYVRIFAVRDLNVATCGIAVFTAFTLHLVNPFEGA
jgi:hypothetical protein